MTEVKTKGKREINRQYKYEIEKEINDKSLETIIKYD